MTPVRWAIVVFWFVVIVMIIKSCHDAEEQRKQDALLHPQADRFTFTEPSAPPAPAPAPAPEARVEQISFSTKPSTPTPGSFTCFVTLRNTGSKKAQNIQIRVRPYRGTPYGDPDYGHQNLRPLSETDPLSQYGSWIGFPDLDPGQSSTQSVVFLDHPNATPGTNPTPEIIFGTVKTP